MTLSVRPTPYIIPAYSLTGDLLAYLRCGLQYRYHHRGALPPSKPVQRWFGEFLHGVMEETYRQWSVNAQPFPWLEPALLNVENLIIQRLGARGLWPRNRTICDLSARRNNQPVNDLAHRRASAAINIWGPHLFPLIAKAEVRLKGIRLMPGNIPNARADYYEIQGVVDVLTSVELATAEANNQLLKALQANQEVGMALSQVVVQGGPTGPTCEVIVDYKGMRRPAANDPSLKHLDWQILTYAWLRGQQPGAASVVGGVLLFLNELEPTRDDMEQLWEEVCQPGTPYTDVVPFGPDLASLQAWHPKRRGKPPTLSLEYRTARSVRVVPVTSSAVQNSLSSFDQTVADIEQSIVQEGTGQPLTGCWQANPIVQTCAICDFRTYCPASPRRGAPLAP